jgi:uncharacterized membrane protein
VSVWGILIAAVAGAAVLTAMTLWARPRFERVAARRDEIGDRELPRRKLVRTMAIAIPGVLVAVLVPVIWSTDVALVLGTVALCWTYWFIVWMTLRDAEAVQREP